MKRIKVNSLSLFQRLREFNMGKKIIIVDDEAQITELLGNCLKQMKYEVLTFNGGNPCIEYLKNDGRADLIISDIRMPDGEGPSILAYLNENKVKIPCVFMTGFSGGVEHETLKTDGAKDVLHKPFKLNDIMGAIKKFAA